MVFWGFGILGAILFFALDVFSVQRAVDQTQILQLQWADTLGGSTGTPLPFPLPVPATGALLPDREGKIFLPAPSNIRTVVEFDPETGLYMKSLLAGDRPVGRPIPMGFQEYLDFDIDRALRENWREMATHTMVQEREGLIPEIRVGGELFERLFGGRSIDIRPTGSAELIFGIMSNRREDPALDQRRRRTTNFDFQQRIQVGVEAQIGEKINISTNFNTEATFDFENRMKLEYRGTEDEGPRVIEPTQHKRSLYKQ